MSGIENVNQKSEAEVVLLACGHCLGFLSSFEADARAFRQQVYAIDRLRNADQPPFEL
ncbi:hypothetical protein [Caballeronia sp. GAWG1-1]|uniref:hypothetical protein n=1 Tax=Caballeronia sp. GAWG1-1 TaxID=2921742 RepID=UPI0020282C73|nr:hypothetical protein [Caballeronia sp. GAWG1-1]